MNPWTGAALKTVEQLTARLEDLEQVPAVRMANRLWIKDKGGRLVPLECNAVQAKIERAIAKLKAAGRPVRLIILKCRQPGVSTWFAGRYYDDVSTRENRRALIVAHDTDSTAEIFEKTKLMHEMNPQAPRAKRSNRKELAFEAPLRSSIAIETAGKVQLGRGQTIQDLHCSEVAFWADAKKSLEGLMQTVPDHPDTCVTLESTANGIGNEFHNLWLRASDPEIETEWVAVFFAWWEEPSYERKPRDDFEPTIEELALQKRFRLNRRQLAWRRWAIENKCGGDEKTFRQEYPACPEEAFLASGRPVFDHDLLQDMLAGKIKGGDGYTGVETPKIGELLEDERTGELKFVERPNGRLKVWRFPHPLGQYAMGTDVSEGQPGGDGAGTVVIHARALSDCADLHGNIPPDDLARETYKLHRWYNLAPCCPDAVGVGQAFVNVYKELRGANLYHRTIRDKQTNEWIDQLGYRTTSTDARSLLIHQYEAAVRAGHIKMRDADAAREHLTFVYTERGRPDHQEGCHDDRVFKRMLAYEMVRAEPWRPPSRSRKRLLRGPSVPAIPPSVRV